MLTSHGVVSLVSGTCWIHDYSGVDILRSEKDGQHFVIELNSTPGWQGLQTVTERNIAGAVVDLILGKRG